MKIVFFILLTSFSLAQPESNPVDYSQIESEIFNDNGDFFYPDLLAKYEQYEELTNEEYRYLYYGYTFQEAYRPFEEDTLGIQISTMLSEGLDTENTEVLIVAAEEYLANNPFSLKMLYYLQNFHQVIQNFDTSIEIQKKYDGIIAAILSSGDGLSLETAFSVNNPSDEHMVMRSLGFKPVKHDFQPTYDYYEVAENENGYDGVYFDVTRLAQVGTAQMGIETIEIDEQDQELLEEGIEVGSPEEVNEFVYTGREVLFQLKADVNGDNLEDWIVITNKTSEDVLSNFAANEPEKRELIVLIRNEDLLLEEVIVNDNAIPCIDCGGANEDPFVNLDFADGKIRIATKGGDLFRWERLSSFEFVDGDWYLVEDAFTSYRKGSTGEKNVEVETYDDFGPVLLRDFNAYAFLN